VFQEKIIYKKIDINALPSEVWKALTDTDMMQEWMLDEDIHILTNWNVDSPIIITGILNGHTFENKGAVLKYEYEKNLHYSHLSSLSNLSDEEKNYVVYNFNLTQRTTHTSLSVTIHNFPTESIYQHMNFYWNTTLNFLKQFIEKQKN
jgi:uncharacterized protein YndB with AHSA1/START domain